MKTSEAKQKAKPNRACKKQPAAKTDRKPYKPTAKWWLKRDMEFEPELAAMAKRWHTPEKRREMAELFADWAAQLVASADRMERTGAFLELPSIGVELN